MSSTTNRPRVVLGITGSVATVKVCEFVFANLQIPELCVKLHEFAEVSIIATQPSLHFLNISKELNSSITAIRRYNPQIYEEYLALNIPVYTDHDEWDNYKSVKKDPVLHVDVFDSSSTIVVT